MTPVMLALTLEMSPTWRLSTSVRLIGGLTPAISFRNDGRKNQQIKTETAAKAKGRALRRSSTDIFRAISATPRLLAEILRRLRINHLAVDADVGLGDPADTGQLFGMVLAVTHAMPSKQNVSIVIRPDFAKSRASGRIDAELSFIPLTLIGPGARFAWHIMGSRR